MAQDETAVLRHVKKQLGEFSNKASLMGAEQITAESIRLFLHRHLTIIEKNCQFAERRRIISRINANNERFLKLNENWYASHFS